MGRGDIAWTTRKESGLQRWEVRAQGAVSESEAESQISPKTELRPYNGQVGKGRTYVGLTVPMNASRISAAPRASGYFWTRPSQTRLGYRRSFGIVVLVVTSAVLLGRDTSTTCEVCGYPAAQRLQLCSHPQYRNDDPQRNLL